MREENNRAIIELKNELAGERAAREEKEKEVDLLTVRLSQAEELLAHQKEDMCKIWEAISRAFCQGHLSHLSLTSWAHALHNMWPHGTNAAFLRGLSMHTQHTASPSSPSSPLPPLSQESITPFFLLLSLPLFSHPPPHPRLPLRPSSSSAPPLCLSTPYARVGSGCVEMGPGLVGPPLEEWSRRKAVILEHDLLEQPLKQHHSTTNPFQTPPLPPSLLFKRSPLPFRQKVFILEQGLLDSRRVDGTIRPETNTSSSRGRE
ncbi:unnamed protein product [Closterium sp. NIES-65]|nr:unnamed protein product [Closterium sp. NIES-65]